MRGITPDWDRSGHLSVWTLVLKMLRLYLIFISSKFLMYSLWTFLLLSCFNFQVCNVANYELLSSRRNEQVQS